MYKIKFYRDKKGKSEIVEYLDALKNQSKTSKTARINLIKIMSYIEALQERGTRIGQPFTKHIDDEIWELRPLANRIFFFYWQKNHFVLLHHFIKKTRKTPPKEIEAARLKLHDFLERQGK